MPGERLARILAELLGQAGVLRSSARLCEVCAEVVQVTGAGIMLMADDVPRGSLCSTNDVSQVIEDLQYTLGEGPCVEAHETDRVIIEADLAAQDPVRWLAFSPPAVDAGVRAVFAFPMQTGSVRLGALNLYRDRPGPLTDDQHADALVMADVAARWVLDLQARAPQGGLPEDLEHGADLHLVVHNAAGIVAVQLDVSITEALIRLRAYAFSLDRPLNEVAGDIVAHRLWIR